MINALFHCNLLKGKNYLPACHTSVILWNISLHYKTSWRVIWKQLDHSKSLKLIKQSALLLAYVQREE